MEKYIIKKFNRPSEEIIHQFKQFDVSTVYEAQGQRGLLSEKIRSIQTGKMICGPALTAVCYAGDNLMVHAAIEVCEPGDILVITTIGESMAGMIGELIVTALKKRGVEGVIIDAGVRDVAKIREMGFPVWAKGIYSEGTTKIKGGWVNAPAICGGVQIEPGDLILADDDGVVVVKQDETYEVLQKASERLKREAETKRKIMDGEVSLDIYGLRATLEKEKVNYYETVSEFMSKPEECS